MQKKTIHPKSSEKMKNAISELLAITRMVDGIPNLDFTAKQFEKIVTEINKRKETCKFDEFQCKLIFLHKISYFYTHVARKGNNYPAETIEQEERQELTEFIYNSFLKCPSTYTVRFTLNELELPQNTSYKNIKVIKRQTPQFAFGAFKSLPTYVSELEFYGTGCYIPYTKNDFIKEYINDLNIFIYFITEHKLAIPKQNTSNTPILTLGLYNTHDKHLIQKYTATICDDHFPLESYDEALPLSISKFISSLESNPNPPIEPNELINSVNNKTNQLIDDQSSEAKRIKMAIGWYMNSAYNEDDTMSFLQICMGLEAIFGDDQDQGGLTKMLADRCAYLIGKNINQRRNIKEVFGKIYTIRSKIVHGVINRLSEEDKFTRNHANSLLKIALEKEIRNLGY